MVVKGGVYVPKTLIQTYLLHAFCKDLSFEITIPIVVSDWCHRNWGRFGCDLIFGQFLFWSLILDKFNFLWPSHSVEYPVFWSELMQFKCIYWYILHKVSNSHSVDSLGVLHYNMHAWCHHGDFTGDDDIQMNTVCPQVPCGFPLWHCDAPKATGCQCGSIGQSNASGDRADDGTHGSLSDVGWLGAGWCWVRLAGVEPLENIWTYNIHIII